MRDNNGTRQFKDDQYFRVVLTCGHTVKVRDELKLKYPGAKFFCTAGNGCGYNLGWVSFTSDYNPGRIEQNPRHSHTG